MDNKVCVTCHNSFPVESLYYKLDSHGAPKYPYCNTCILVALKKPSHPRSLVNHDQQLISKQKLKSKRGPRSSDMFLHIGCSVPGDKRWAFYNAVESGAHLIDVAKDLDVPIETAYKWWNKIYIPKGKGLTPLSTVRCLECDVEYPYISGNFYVHTSIKENFCVCQSCMALKRPEKDKEWKRKYRHKRHQNPSYKLADYLRTSLWCAINRRGFKRDSSSRIFKILGCTITELKAHLESEFTEGMTWDNYGRNGWHVDHIRPCASFNLIDPDQVKACFHYTNLQPLWAADNISKSSLYNGARYRMGSKL